MALPETTRLTITEAPLDMSTITGLVLGRDYTIVNESPVNRVFLADAVDRPTPRDAAIPLAPGKNGVVTVEASPKTWLWTEAGNTGTVIIHPA